MGVRRRDVTPCVGVWIEITYHLSRFLTIRVTPCVGVWIEIRQCHQIKYNA